MRKLALSADEVLVLKNYFQSSPITLIRVKAQALLMKDGGLSQAQIARFVVRDVRSVARYIKDFSERRLASLFSGHIDNENAAKLTRAQKQQIRKVLLKPPSEKGLPKQFWDVPSLRRYVKAKFGVIYESDISYYFLLKFSNLSFKYPDKTSPRRDEPFIKKRIKEIKKEIKPFLKDPRWIVLASDETRIQLEAEIRRAWLQKGVKTKIKTEKSKIHQNYLGFLDQKTGKCQVFKIQKGNGKETVRILKQLIAKYPDRRVCVVWDNAKWHKGRLIRQKLLRGKPLEKLHLIAFPPYAPETNPIEHVWQNAKNKLSNKSDVEFEEIKKQFFDIISQGTFNYKI